MFYQTSMRFLTHNVKLNKSPNFQNFCMIVKEMLSYFVEPLYLWSFKNNFVWVPSEKILDEVDL